MRESARFTMRAALFTRWGRATASWCRASLCAARAGTAGNRITGSASAAAAGYSGIASTGLRPSTSGSRSPTPRPIRSRPASATSTHSCLPISCRPATRSARLRPASARVTWFSRRHWSGRTGGDHGCQTLQPESHRGHRRRGPAAGSGQAVRRGRDGQQCDDRSAHVVRALTEGLGADVTIEAVGQPRPSSWPSRMSRPGGRIANIGVHGKPAALHLEDQWIRDVTVTTGLVDTSSVPTLLRLLASGQLDARKLVTHRFGFDDFDEAYEVFSQSCRYRRAEGSAQSLMAMLHGSRLIAVRAWALGLPRHGGRRMRHLSHPHFVLDLLRDRAACRGKSPGAARVPQRIRPDARGGAGRDQDTGLRSRIGAGQPRQAAGRRDSCRARLWVSPATAHPRLGQPVLRPARAPPRAACP